jgi:hypothetical protein
MGPIFHSINFNVMNFCTVPTLLNAANIICQVGWTEIWDGRHAPKVWTNLIFVLVGALGHTRSELGGGPVLPLSQYVSFDRMWISR